MNKKKVNCDSSGLKLSPNVIFQFKHFQNLSISTVPTTVTHREPQNSPSFFNRHKLLSIFLSRERIFFFIYLFPSCHVHSVPKAKPHTVNVSLSNSQITRKKFLPKVGISAVIQSKSARCQTESGYQNNHLVLHFKLSKIKKKKTKRKVAIKTFSKNKPGGRKKVNFEWIFET